jgi:CDP-diacylglycerol--serine O-phosphatidyltransferase
MINARKGIHILPSLFTTGNVFCGFYSFIAALNEKYYLAAWAIVLAIIFDILDGRIARMTKTTSAFGMQYDSLADVISFGMAPAFLCYAWVLRPFGSVGWMAAFLYLLCAALRLARFNATKSDIQGQCFIGLATPAAAAVLASTIIAFENLFGSRVNPGFIMVSNIKYPAFKKFEFRKRVSFTRFLLVVLVLYILATIPKIALFIISFGYTIFGPIKEWISQKGKLKTTLDTVKQAENN